jgi:hypothetical protein
VRRVLRIGISRGATPTQSPEAWGILADRPPMSITTPAQHRRGKPVRRRRGGKSATHRRAGRCDRSCLLVEVDLCSRDTLDVIVLVLLAAAGAHVVLARKTAEPPQWMGKLETASRGSRSGSGSSSWGVSNRHSHFGRRRCVPGKPRRSLVAPASLPGTHAADTGAVDAHRARVRQPGRAFLPKARDWMNTNSWCSARSCSCTSWSSPLPACWGGRTDAPQAGRREKRDSLSSMTSGPGIRRADGVLAALVKSPHGKGAHSSTMPSLMPATTCRNRRRGGLTPPEPPTSRCVLEVIEQRTAGGDHVRHGP